MFLNKGHLHPLSKRPYEFTGLFYTDAGIYMHKPIDTWTMQCSNMGCNCRVVASGDEGIYANRVMFLYRTFKSQGCFLDFFL